MRGLSIAITSFFLVLISTISFGQLRLDSIIQMSASDIDEGLTVNSRKYEFSFDNNGKVISQMSYSWNNVTEAWGHADEKNEFTHTGENTFLEESFTWNEDATSWDQKSKCDMEIDEDGFVIESICYHVDTDKKKNKGEYAYENGKETLRKYSNWDATSQQWTVYREDVYLFNSFGQEVEYSFSGTKDGVYRQYSRSEASFNSRGEITESIRYLYNDDQSEWELYGKNEYSLDQNGRTTERITYNYRDGDWVESYKDNYAYDSEGNRTERLYYVWRDNDWLGSRKTMYSYEQGVLIETVLYDWDDDLFQWTLDNKYNNTLDDRTNIIENHEFHYEDGEWLEIIDEYPAYYTYLAEGVSLTELRIMLLTFSEESRLLDQIGEDNILSKNIPTSFEGGLGFHSIRNEYFYFSESTETGISNLDGATVNTYPNPVQNILHIEFDGVMEVYNGQGAVLSIGDVIDNKVDVSDLNAGIYFYNLTNGEQTFNGKFIKR